MEDELAEIEKLQKNLLIVAATLLVSGIIMVFSSSYMYSMDVFGNPSYIFFKQFGFALFGVSLAWVVNKTKITFWIKYAQFFHMIMVFFLLLTVVPGLGVTTKGSSRWIQFFGLGFQPGEPIKYTIMLVALHFFDQFNNLNTKQRVTYAAWIILPLIFLVLQPDFGTFTICSIVVIFSCFISSFPRKYFYGSLPIALAIGIMVLVSQPYRVRRLFSFLDPWKNPRGSGFQIIQSLYGFANGALFGQGLGNSNGKLFYLPEAHNDFIFSIIGEEVGFVGVLFLIVLFLALVYFGFKIATRLSDRLAAILVTCIIFSIGLQALVNMGVVIGMLPTKGLNLPFISYGGTSLVTNLFALGLVFSAIRHEKRKLNAASAQESSSTQFPSGQDSYYNRPLSRPEMEYRQGNFFDPNQ